MCPLCTSEIIKGLNREKKKYRVHLCVQGINRKMFPTFFLCFAITFGKKNMTTSVQKKRGGEVTLNSPGVPSRTYQTHIFSFKGVAFSSRRGRGNGI